MIAPKSMASTIWVDSPCSLSYTSNLPPLERAKRFHFNSIYYRDDPNKPAKREDQLRKPDLLISDFRRNIKEVDNSLKRKSELVKLKNCRVKKNKHQVSYLPDKKLEER